MPPEEFTEAFAMLVADHRNDRAWSKIKVVADEPLRRIVVRFLGSGRQQEVEDALSVTWMRFMTRLTRAGPEPLPATPWQYLRRIARNCAIDLNRRRDARPPSEDLVISPTDSRDELSTGAGSLSRGPDPLETAIAKDLLAYLETKLSKKEWAVICDLATGFTSSEVAERLSLSEVNIRKIKERALLHVTALLAVQTFGTRESSKPAVTKRPNAASE